VCDLHYQQRQRIDWNQVMLRITVHNGETTQTILLEGKISGPWVEEFAHAWHRLTPALGAKKLQLDLRNVDFVDAKGTQLLRDIYRQSKACFLTDSPLTQYFADVAMRNVLKDGKPGV
jgi:ABC-type transporter Mla MlaB component